MKLNSEKDNFSLSLVSGKEKIFEEDVWHLKSLGFTFDEIPSSRDKINFKRLEYNWLIILMKETIWRKRNAVGGSSLISYVRNMTSVVEYSKTLNVELELKDLNFSFMEGYFRFLCSKSKATQNAYYSGLNEIFTCWNEWGYISHSLNPLPRELKPRNIITKKPKSLSPYVQAQIIKAAKSKSSIINRWILIMLEIGARGHEALLLKNNCLSKDSNGWILTRENKKFQKDLSIPITSETAGIIKEQILKCNEICKEHGKENKQGYIFSHYWKGKISPYTLRFINICLRKFVDEHSIVDELGSKVSISTHNFRHTVATNLINNGVSQFHVQKFLGHESSGMTNMYAEIHDSTLRKELLKANSQMADINGKIYSIIDVANQIDEDKPIEENIDLDIHWLRKNIGTQILPNGICALPIKTACNHANACLTCPSFRSSKEHLSTHILQRDRTIKIIDAAKNNGMSRQVEINTKLLNNINNLIGALNDE